MGANAVELDLIEARLKHLRTEIDDLGHEIDTYKAKTAAALGGGVFLLLLALGAGYDLVAGKTFLYLAIGITREMFYWVAGGLAIASLALLLVAALRERRRDYKREARLVELEQEFAELLERKETHTKG